MVKKYKYILIVILLVLITPITTSKINNSISVFNIQQSDYESFVEGFLSQVREVQEKNPISRTLYETKGEQYFYNSIIQREKVLDRYSYTEDRVPAEYIDIHRQLVEFITIYRDGINIVKEGVQISSPEIVERGIARIIEANELFIKIEYNFMLKQVP